MDRSNIKYKPEVKAVLSKFVKDVDAGKDIQRDVLQLIAKGISKYLQNPPKSNDPFRFSHKKSIKPSQIGLLKAIESHFELELKDFVNKGFDRKDIKEYLGRNEQNVEIHKSIYLAAFEAKKTTLVQAINLWEDLKRDK